MTDWQPLKRELRAWQTKGATLPLWWRDDDAVAPGAALDRLEHLAGRLHMPVHLAVIPARATTALGNWIDERPDMHALVHGWAHQSHAANGEKNSEFAPGRPLADRLNEAAQGLERLTEICTVAPVFVPPWNRIGSDMAPGLVQAGFRALSTFGPRRHPEAASGLARINTHLDPIDWRGSRSLADPARLITQISDQLAERRMGRADNGEPYGILTHHLVHDDAIWTFTETLLRHLLDGPVSLWQAGSATIPPGKDATT